MTKDKLVVAPEGTDLKQAEQILKEYRIEKLPVVDGNGKLIGLITYRDIIKVQSFPNACKDSLGWKRESLAGQDIGTLIPAHRGLLISGILQSVDYKNGTG